MSKKIITNKQKIILLILYIFRFVNSKQIQEFLEHKDHRRINSWLKDLVDKGYIERDFKPIYGILTKPAVYNLSALGRQYIKKGYRYFFPTYLRRISRDNKASKGFRIKCQIIADWYLMLYPELKEEQKKKATKEISTGITIINSLITELINGEEHVKVPLNSKQFFTPAYFPSFILLEKIKPDGYIRKRTTKGIIHGLLFVIDAYIPRFLLRYTLKRIFDAIHEESWEENVQSLNIFFLCPNNQIIIYMRRVITQNMNSYYSSTPLTLNFATRNQLYKRKEGKRDTVGWKVVSSEDY